MNSPFHDSNTTDSNSSPTTSSTFFPNPASFQWQLFLVFGLASLLTSGSLNIFLLKNNHTLRFQRQQQTEQRQRNQQNEIALRSLLQDTANLSVQYPELKSILAKYGYSVNVLPSSSSIAPPIPPPPLSTPPSQK